MKASMKKLLYFSPLPPHKSGIADYSMALIAGLAEHFDITIAVEPIRIINPGLYNVDEKDLFRHYSPELYEKYKVKQVGWDEINFNDYDYRIYNLGNNPYYHSYMYDYALHYPGLVILHDYVLFYLVVGRYWGDKQRFFKKVFKIGGLKGLVLIGKLLLRRRHPLHCEYDRVQSFNFEILNSKNKIMVHSNFAKQKILNEFPQKENEIHIVNMISDPQDETETSSEEIKKKFNIGADDIIISSFGHIAETKLNHVVCKIIKALSKDYSRLRYIMVGEGGYIDHYLDGKVIRKTGYVDLRDFVGFIKASDLVINLRNPSMGETSAAVIRILREGKPCVVSDDAWFSELPSNTVIKISNARVEEELNSVILDFLKSRDKFQHFGERARQMIKDDYSSKSVSLKIKNLLENS